MPTEMPHGRREGTAPGPDGGKVREMFAAIAGRYDLTNTVLSGGLHHVWKRRVATAVPASCRRVLDLCTGTGDLLPRLASPGRVVTGGDFCAPMLERARDRYPGVPLVLCDAARLPFADGSFDAVTVAFGVRNLEDLGAGLSEMRRVLVPGGTLVVLEFGRPSSVVWRAAYDVYSDHVLPRVGGLLTGRPEAYRYLPETAKRFPCGARFAEILTSAGYDDVAVRPLTGGVAYLYTALRR